MMTVPSPSPVAIAVRVAADALPAGGLELVGQLGQLGLTGGVILAVLFRKLLVPEWTLRDAEARLAANEARHAVELAARDARIAVLEETQRQGQEMLTERVVPALTLATQAQQELLEQTSKARPSRRPTPDGA